MDAWINLISTGGVGVILAWYLYYTTTQTLPRMQQAHEQALQTIVERFAAELDLERQARAPLQVTMQKLVRALKQRPCILEKSPFASIPKRDAEA